jgi:hypothetical protein
MSFYPRNLAKFRAIARRRIEDLRARARDSLEVAVDTMMDERIDSFFRIEQGLDEIEKSLATIEEEMAAVFDLAGAVRMSSRLEFVEDLFDELDSDVRQRPPRRKRRINLADFLRAAGGSGEPGEAARSEITNAFDAYRVLGLDEGCSLADVTAAFRKRAKDLHPDARNGDRSSEPELRRIIEAHQFLKEHLSLSNTEPPFAGRGGFSPAE